MFRKTKDNGCLTTTLPRHNCTKVELIKWITIGTPVVAGHKIGKIEQY